MQPFVTKALAEAYLRQKNYHNKFGDVWSLNDRHFAVIKPPRHFGDVWRVYKWSE